MQTGGAWPNERGQTSMAKRRMIGGGPKNTEMPAYCCAIFGALVGYAVAKAGIHSTTPELDCFESYIYDNTSPNIWR